jgi:hypothetical protein
MSISTPGVHLGDVEGACEEAREVAVFAHPSIEATLKLFLRLRGKAR